ncbi:MAG: hypothetical protein AAGA66_15445 [Bacteroidota bacterium]
MAVSLTHAQTIVTGKIVDITTGQALSEIEVASARYDTTAWTNKRGYFQIPCEKGDTLTIYDKSESYQARQIVVPTTSYFMIELKPAGMELVSNKHEQGQLLNGYKRGLWHYYDNGEKTLSVNYDNSAIEFLKEDTTSYAVFVDGEWTYKQLEHYPRYLGSYDEFHAILHYSILFPRDLIRMGVEGTLHLMFEVDTLGKVTNTFIINNLGLNTKKSAIEGLKKVPNLWISAEYGERKVKSRFHIPVSFTYHEGSLKNEKGEIKKLHQNWDKRMDPIKEYVSTPLQEIIFTLIEVRRDVKRSMK